MHRMEFTTIFYTSIWYYYFNVYAQYVVLGTYVYTHTHTEAQVTCYFITSES